MAEYKNEVDFLKLLEVNNSISGKFRIKQGSEALMDLYLNNFKFQNCTILGGDFCSSVFKNCTFDNVLFKNLSLVGVTFENCDFINCKFSNLQLSISIKDCRVDGLRITHESF